LQFSISFFLFTIKDETVKTISKNKNKSMHSLTDNCCETHFHLLCIVLRSFVTHNTTELFSFFYCTENIK